MPTWGEVAQLITAFAVALTAWSSMRNGRKIEEVHKATNSMKDELVAATRSESHAAGVAEGTLTEQIRVAELKG